MKLLAAAGASTFAQPLDVVAAGVVSFSCPCCLPLVPRYLSYISALPIAQLGTGQSRPAHVQTGLLFLAGFAAVVTLLGFSATWLPSG
jgi:cytochrome c-type biogenesis protein